MQGPGSDVWTELRPKDNLKGVMRKSIVFVVLLPLFLLLAGGGRMGVAQESTWRAVEGLPVGSEAERYLRVLQVAGEAPLYPWTIRGFTSGELPDVVPGPDVDHPWKDDLDYSLPGSGEFRVGLTRAEVGAVYNSAFPFGENDGAVWAGRGVTGDVKAGAFLGWGPLHVRIAPEVFWAQNAGFELAPNALQGDGAFRDGRFPTNIDRPQRFGPGSVARVNLGSSSVHASLPRITLGISNAGQQWGPAVEYPLMLGNNAGGFPHLFLQTAPPLDLWVARLHGRFLAGRLDQSEYSPYQRADGRRFVSAVTLTVLPRGLDGLELGFTRFVQAVWPEEGITARQVLRPFSHVTHDFTTTENPSEEDQRAGAFFRWTLPAAGFEVYGELIREDFGRDFRHYLEEPDDLTARMLGFQKVWSLQGGQFLTLRGEVVGSEVHHSERFDRFRRPGWTPRPWPPYIHGARLPQGHTHRGQLLGSPAAYGGSAWTLGMDLFHPDGRWSIDLSRTLVTDWLWIHQGTTGPGIADVIYALQLEMVRFARGFEWFASVTPSINLNRNVEEGNDVFNLNVGLGLRGIPW